MGGLLSGFFGVGGNFILVPLLGIALGLTQQQAQGLTLAALLPPLGLPAVWQYRRSGIPLLWPIVGACILGFLPAIPLGSVVANHLPASALRGVFSVLLVMMAVRVWGTPKAKGEQVHMNEPPSGFVPKAMLSGAAAGFASGLLGIGGAIVLIPLLTRQLGLSQKQAQVTSLAMLLPPIALPGVFVYANEASLPWLALLPVMAGFVLGAFLGAKLNTIVSPERLTRGFAVLLLISAAVLFTSALRS